MRRHKTFFSSFKLITVGIVFLFVLWVYAKEINEGSTAGYFLKQEMKDLEQLSFNQHIVELDVLMLERELWRDVNEINDAWYDHTDRMIIVPTYDATLVKR